MATIPFLDRNRRLEPTEAFKESLRTLQDDGKSAVNAAIGAIGLSAFPSYEEKAEAMESLEFSISCLETALAAARVARRNLKKM